MRKPCREKKEMKRGAWSKQEDQKLIDYIKKHGEGCWRTLPQAAGLRRCGKSCRQRWINYLRPNFKTSNFAEDEEDLLIKLHALLGNRWSLIAGRLPGRTDNEVENYWNTHLKRKLIKMGINPNNHPLVHKIRPLGNPSSSAGLKENGKKNPEKPVCQNNDQVSDAKSGLEDEANGLPDLNVDISTKIHATSSTSIVESSERSRKPHLVSSPTLLLFL